MCRCSVPQPAADRHRELEGGVGDHVLERQIVRVEADVRDFRAGIRSGHVLEHAVGQSPDVSVTARRGEAVALVAHEVAHVAVPQEVDALGVVVGDGAVAVLGLRVVPLVRLAHAAAAQVRRAGVEVDLAGQRLAGLQGVDGLGSPEPALVVLGGVHGLVAERREQEVAESHLTRTGRDQDRLVVAGVAHLHPVDVDVDVLDLTVREDGVLEGDHVLRIGLGVALVGAVAGGVARTGSEAQGREGPEELGHWCLLAAQGRIGVAPSNHSRKARYRLTQRRES